MNFGLGKFKWLIDGSDINQAPALPAPFYLYVPQDGGFQLRYAVVHQRLLFEGIAGGYFGADRYLPQVHRAKLGRIL